MKCALFVCVLALACVTVSAGSVKASNRAFVALNSHAKAKSDWEECGFSQEYEKSGQYNFEFKDNLGRWEDATGFLVHCRLGTNPLFLQIVGENEMWRVNWPDFIDENMLFRQGTQYGLRIQVSNQEHQNWEFLFLKWDSLDGLNKFARGAQTHLNIRQNAIDARWKHFTDQDFVRAPKMAVDNEAPKQFF
mmetsp:Transcript_22759/g.45041  ORF Transcript_22759/g.45041 Transcript_22759/m.45041 type:complete len:191 (-) Transcript_22759:184-756(-)|eukprot:CAMPEP_0175139896 /NCGR_PEP_ID=MMETSP0087-20121206/11169_1 /TAXON_ID=136419 /ORGANISM="Unknown Unknown, Strain D1" /LENGTH=190 /DNA_ID=CAMNT_0016422981 /DNA_START=11 /DNA_END=583 /DNA_ORIENTATION=-